MNFKIQQITRFLAAGLILAFSASALANTTYVSDQGHTEIQFTWNHVGITRQSGEFTKSVITVNLADKLEDSTVEVEIDTNSLSSGFEALDKHLKSADFFEVETYPTATFKSTAVEMTGEKTMNVTGDLTIHGVTKSVTLAAELTLKGKHPVAQAFDHYKGEWVAFQATAEIDHQAFGIGKFSTGPITITINTEMKAP